MKENVNKSDVVIRLIIGALLLCVGAFISSPLLYVIAAILIVTAITKRCPIYWLFDMYRK